MAKNYQNPPFQAKNDLKLHVLTEKRLKITFSTQKWLKMTSNKLISPQNTTF